MLNHKELIEVRFLEKLSVLTIVRDVLLKVRQERLEEAICDLEMILDCKILELVRESKDCGHTSRSLLKKEIEFTRAYRQEENPEYSDYYLSQMDEGVRRRVLEWRGHVQAILNDSNQ